MIGALLRPIFASDLLRPQAKMFRLGALCPLQQQLESCDPETPGVILFGMAFIVSGLDGRSEKRGVPSDLRHY